MVAANTLGRFHIIRELARSNDIVYEAMDPTSGRRIALKELQIAPNLTGQARQERIQRFTREARAAAGLKHRNVVRIHEHGQAGGRYFIAMEFLQGQSLRDILRQRGPLPLQEALRIAGEVADGLEFAHGHSVIHRDIKPDNVHVEPDGRVVLTDFGIARITFEPTLTADGQVFGTPSYMSPEQVRGQGVDARSDLFSLGVMLYEMVTGQKPFTGDSVITVTYNIMNQEIPLAAGVPPGITAILRRATAKDPGQRYRSARELREDLRLVEQGRPPCHAGELPPPPAGYSRVSLGSGRLPPPGQGIPRPPGSGTAGYPPPPAIAGAPQGGPSSLPPAPTGRLGPGGLPPPGARAAPQLVYIPPAPAPPPIPPPVQWGASPAPPHSSGTGGWMVGWIALLGVLALMIAGIVWATMKSMETMELRARARTASQARMSADRLFQQRRFREAIQAYGRLAAGSQTERPAALRMAAWSAGEAVQSEMGAAVIPRQRDLPSRQQEWRELCARALQWNRNSPSVHLALARVAASARQFDAAADTLQQTESLAVRQRNAGDPNQRSEAEGVYRSIVAWRAAFKYEEASGLVARFPQKARSRLEEVRNLVPNTAFAKQAETILKRLAETYRGATQDPEPGSAGSDSSSGSLGAPGFAPPYNGSPYPNQGQFPSQPQPGVAPGGPGGGAGRYSPGLDGPMVPPAGWDPNIRLSPGLPGIR